ncbi:MAG: DUF1080 domain-containing protein [Planctomycetaceae bacterium]|jgi:hypothetical protein|nr:DUF1080 domain-containing protein [Planctomycetaceae bacterium]
MKRINIFVTILFVIFVFAELFVIFVSELSAQGSNTINPLSASKPAQSEVKHKSSNPYSILIQQLVNSSAEPLVSPDSKTNSNSGADDSEIPESIAPYDSGRNIFLDYGNSATEKDKRRNRKKENINITISQDAARIRAKEIILEYDPEQKSYEDDLAKLIAIDEATSVNKKKPLAKPNSISDSASDSVTNNPDISNGVIASLHGIMPNNNSTGAKIVTDSLIIQWERELVNLMKSEESDNKSEKSEKIAALSLRIERRKQFLTRQAETLQGADVFVAPLTVKLSQRYLEDGWCNLFDGKTLFGWRIQESGFYGGGNFTVEKGEICSDPYRPGLLYTTNQFGDSTITFEYCTDDNAELFLLYRTSPNPHDLNTSCYTVVLNSSDPKRPRGTILGRVQLDREQLRSINKNSKSDNHDSDKTEKTSKEVWHRARFSCDGGSILCTIDNQLPTSLVDTNPIGRGYIGLLVTCGKVRFRNINWRPGAAFPLFDGIDINSSWRYKQNNLAISTNNMAIQLRNGPGIIETLDSFSDFVLQFEYKVINASSKAGLFFRSNVREERSGYEISLQNFPSRKDRDEFIGIDAGAFVGRKNGRYVGAEDMQWNYFTLNAVDRQFQTWINGIPVCEITDKNKLPKTFTLVKAKDTLDGKEILGYEIPQKDEFHLEGTIQFYLPSDNSNFEIRNIRITKIAKRNPKKQTFEDYKKSTWKAKIKENERIKEENKLNDEWKKNKKL